MYHCLLYFKTFYLAPVYVPGTDFPTINMCFQRTVSYLLGHYKDTIGLHKEHGMIMRWNIAFHIQRNIWTCFLWDYAYAE